MADALLSKSRILGVLVLVLLTFGIQAEVTAVPVQVTSSPWMDVDRNRVFDDLDFSLSELAPDESVHAILVLDVEPTESLISAFQASYGPFNWLDVSAASNTFTLGIDG